MAKTNFTRERRNTWATSSLPGPPGLFPPTMRFKRSLPLHDAGPYTALLVRQCLHLLDDIHDELHIVSRSAFLGGIRADDSIGDITERIYAVSRMLRGYFDRDPALSVGKVLMTLWACKDDMLRMKQRRRFRHW